MKKLGKFDLIPIFIGLFALLYFNNARGTEWKYLNDLGNARILYEAESITRISPSVIQIWIQKIPKDEKARDEVIKHMQKAGDLTKDYHSTLLLFEIDCVAKKSRIISIVDIDKHGQRLNKYEIEPPEWLNIDPESPLYKLALSYLRK